MTKIRKVKKKKKYQYNVNRKRISKRKLIVTESTAAMKNSLNVQTLSHKGFKKLGFVYDVNQDIKHINIEDITHLETLHINEANTTTKDLEKKMESALKGKSFRFSKDQIDFITYLLEKYGDDFKAMSKDKKNYLQYTWKQIRYKIKLFKSIPDHYNEFLKNIKMC